jgi:hypothetical protein
VHYDDAKTYFSAQQKRYDVIVSEPSNPWVNGVSGLFSLEFYRDVRRYLRDDGLFLQWVHVYEMTPPLVATILGALGQNFEDFELWLPNNGDLIVVAVPKGKLPRPDGSAFGNATLRADLARFNIRNLDDLLLYRVGGRSALGPYYSAFGAQPNSDFAPILDLNAALARFLRQQVEDVPLLMEAPIPFLALFDRSGVRQPDPQRLSAGAHVASERAERARRAVLADTYLRAGRLSATDIDALPAALVADLALVRGALLDCRLEVPPATLRRALNEIAALVNAQLARSSRVDLWRRLAASTCGAARVARPWLNLHGALAAEDGPRISAAAEALLQGDLPGELAPYVVAAHMTGLLLANDPRGALRSFQAHRRKLGAGRGTWEPAFRFLVGQTVGG